MTDKAIPSTEPANGTLGVRTSLSPAHKIQALGFGGFLLLLVNFSAPMGGLIDIPVTFFLKNRMHLHANELAVFKLWTGTPLFLSFVFGFLRDRWSPFGGGDRAHLIVFGLITAAIYLAVALIEPTYTVFLVGLFVATMAFQMAGSAAYGITNTVAKSFAVSGQMSSVSMVAYAMPALMSYFAGGFLSEALEGEGAVIAAQILFTMAAMLMVLIALSGRLGPGWLFDASRPTPSTTSLWAELKRLATYWPLYPVMLIQLLWQFAPGIGTVLQYHITDTLHGTDAQWGEWNALFQGAFVPIYFLYGWLCRKIRLQKLLWIGFALGTFQMVPMLFVSTATGALIAAVPLGVMGGIAQAAIVDLTIRAAPRGLESTTMMLFWAMYYIATRYGDLFGTWLYDQHGGFLTAFWATILSTSLTLPILLMVPRRFMATADGEALPEEQPDRNSAPA